MLRTISRPSLYPYIFCIVSTAVLPSFIISVSLHRHATPSCSKLYSSIEQGSPHSIQTTLSARINYNLAIGHSLPWHLLFFKQEHIRNIDAAWNLLFINCYWYDAIQCWTSVVGISKYAVHILPAILINWISWGFNASEISFSSVILFDLSQRLNTSFTASIEAPEQLSLFRSNAQSQIGSLQSHWGFYIFLRGLSGNVVLNFSHDNLQIMKSVYA